MKNEKLLLGSISLLIVNIASRLKKSDLVTRMLSANNLLKEYTIYSSSSSEDSSFPLAIDIAINEIKNFLKNNISFQMTFSESTWLLREILICLISLKMLLSEDIVVLNSSTQVREDEILKEDTKKIIDEPNKNVLKDIFDKTNKKKK